MKKLINLLLFSVIIFFALSIFPVTAQKNELSNKKEIPEVAGTYDDPDHPGIKVRVFVYKAKPDTKPAKPPAPTPSLYCSLEDPQSTAVIGQEKWWLPVSWNYNLNPESVPQSVGKSNLETIAQRSFDSWSTASGNEVDFVRKDDVTINRQALDYKNIVAWGRTSGTALAVTYIRYFPENGAVLDVDTIMNSKFPWTWSNKENCAFINTYDAENILTHELGHWIGLNDMYTADYQHATMYGYGATTEVKKITLSEGDKNGAYQIYHN